jgi:hypothetical protein
MRGMQTWRSRIRAVAIVAAVAAAAVVGAARADAGASTAAGAHVVPNARGELDCNGFSSIQKSVKPTMVCADPRLSPHERFEDNGHYIGHDEPALRFVSSRPGTSSDITWVERLGADPHRLPTTGHPGRDITHNFELTVAPWFSMNVCDPNSDPQLPCTPRSDTNAPHGAYPGGGAAFMELQFYPPGFAPFDDSISCDNTHWCSALTIDSVECDAGGTCNNNCIEPVNFAFIQTNGVPAGAPSPQQSNLATYTPNSHTLLMNQGDRIVIHMFDAKVAGGHALEIRETDRTSGRSGYMIASAANGFMHTSMTDCSGTPFNFQPEYSSAKPQNILPWGAGPYNVNTQFEIGHFEPCTTVTGRSSFTDGPFTDHYFNVCHGAYEADAPGDTPTSNEPGDAPCYRRGDTHGGTTPPNQVTGCDVFFNAVGDLDYDGTSYRADWPTAVHANRYPATFQQRSPTSAGHSYADIQFVTDTSATQAGCDLSSGAGCVLPPNGPGHFYPFWTRARVDGACVWEFGNMRNGNTFGGVRQYGRVGPHTIGAFVSKIRPTPRCG